MATVCPSVCLSRMEGYRKLELGVKEAHGTGDPRPHLEVERSKVKVTRPIIAEAANASYLSKEETLHGDLREGYNITSVVRRMFAHTSTEKKIVGAPKLAQRLSVPWLIFCTTSEVKRSRSPAVLDGCSSRHWQGRGTLWRPYYRSHSLLAFVMIAFHWVSLCAVK